MTFIKMATISVAIVMIAISSKWSPKGSSGHLGLRALCLLASSQSQIWPKTGFHHHHHPQDQENHCNWIIYLPSPTPRWCHLSRTSRTFPRPTEENFPATWVHSMSQTSSGLAWFLSWRYQCFIFLFSKVCYFNGGGPVTILETFNFGLLGENQWKNTLFIVFLK